MEEMERELEEARARYDKPDEAARYMSKMLRDVGATLKELDTAAGEDPSPLRTALIDAAEKAVRAAGDAAPAQLDLIVDLNDELVTVADQHFTLAGGRPL